MSASPTVTRKFNSAMEKLASGCRGVLVGYSGGADSSALLRLMHDWCKCRNIYLKAVHIHHGIRGAEADRDAGHCRQSCLELGIDFELIRADIPELARRSGRGLEETARNFRYEAFARLMAEDDRLGFTATAHNADDNAETLIFKLARGTGVDGLAGIPPSRPLGEGRLIRPLLCCSKREILGYCAENGIEYIFDSTNDDTVYTRNYIRHELMPRLEHLNPSYLDAAARLCSSAREDSEYLGRLADDFIAAHAESGAIPTPALNEAAPPISSRALIRLYSRISSATLERQHIDALLSLSADSREGASLSLPDKVCARIERGRLRFTREQIDSPPRFRYTLHEGVNRFSSPDFAVLIIPEGKIFSDFEKDNESLKNIYKLSIHAELNSDKINHILFLRSRQDGDAYVYGGMTRRLKKLYNDRGFDRETRQKLPVFCDAEGIVWVPGFRPADRRRAADGSPKLIIYYYYN